ncbi:MAG: signal peptidase I [Fibrella sp.]|nr:signal peptidase I [Armatimonadota bacterium]
MQPTNQFTDQLANIDPVFIVGVVVALTLIRAALAKMKDPWARTISETCDTVNFVLILAFLLIRPFIAQAFFIPSESMESTLLVKDRLIVDKFSYRLHEPNRNDVLVFEAPLAATEGGEPNVDYIKRLIGVPGDTIQVKGAQVIVDGETIDARALGSIDTHSYLRERMGLYPDTAVKLFPDYVLVEGKRKVTKEDLAQVLGFPGSKIQIIPGQVYLNGKALNEPFTNEDPGYNYPEDTDQPLKLGKDELFMMGDNRNHSKDSHIWGPLKRERVVGHAVVLFWPPNRMGKIR